MNKIQGPALCGFADMFEDDGEFYRRDDNAGGTVLGAAHKGGKPHKAPALPPVPRPYPKAKQSSTIATHAKILTHARQVLAKAHGQVKTAARKTLAKPTAPKQRVRGQYVTVHGSEYVIVGTNVVPPSQQPKVKAAMAKLDAARAKARQAAHVAEVKTKAAHVTVTKLAAQVKAHENIARKLSGKGGAGVHGYIGADAAGLSPGQPGYDPTSDPSSSQYVDPNTGAPSSAQLDVDTLVAAANVAPIPINTFIPDTTGLPIIKYDGSKGQPDGYVLSYGLATRDTDVYCEPGAPGTIDGTAHFGYCWKTYPERVGGIPWGEDMGHDGWNHLHGRHWESEGGWSTPCSPEEAYQSASKVVDIDAPGARCRGYISGVAKNASYGPLIGNPKMADFVNLRVDANGMMFWMANEAPDYITAPLKAAAALTKAAADKAQKDADAAAAAAAAKTAADQAAALAAQNAQNALDEANAASQARQQSSQASAQSAQAQADADAADAAQARADADAAGPQYQQDLATQQFQLQQAQQQAAADAAQQAQDLAEQKWAFQQAQLQAQQDAAAAQYQTTDSGSDAGGGDGGDLNPEAASDAEAAQIEADADVLGAVLGQPTILGDDAVIGGDGEAIGLDQYGNLTD